VIPPGILLHLDATGTKVQACQNTGAGLGAPAGFSLYLASMPPGGYLVGDMVPVLRRGKIFVTWSGGADSSIGALPAPHVWRPADNSAGNLSKRGYATATATSTTVGSEIAAAPTGVILDKVLGNSAMAVVRVLLA